MHDVFAVEIIDCYADVLEVLADLRFFHIAALYFIEKCSSVCILQDHVSYLFFTIDLVTQKLDDFGMGKSVVENDLVFGKFVYLNKKLMIRF